MMERAYRMRVYPARRQCALLGRVHGAARFVWNWALARARFLVRKEGAH